MLNFKNIPGVTSRTPLARAGKGPEGRGRGRERKGDGDGRDRGKGGSPGRRIAIVKTVVSA